MKTEKPRPRKRPAKLRLSRETLRRLEARELKQANGGYTGRTCPIISWCLC